MLSKKYRLKEGEVKKVLKYGKPFFSYSVVLNYKKNNLKINRYAIVISGKNTKSGVERNYFRRLFYNTIREKKELEKNTGYDLVFLLKKKTKLEKNNLESIKNFKKDLGFLLQKIINKKITY